MNNIAMSDIEQSPVAPAFKWAELTHQQHQQISLLANLGFYLDEVKSLPFGLVALLKSSSTSATVFHNGSTSYKRQ